MKRYLKWIGITLLAIIIIGAVSDYATSQQRAEAARQLDLEIAQRKAERAEAALENAREEAAAKMNKSRDELLAAQEEANSIARQALIEQQSANFQRQFLTPPHDYAAEMEQWRQRQALEQIAQELQQANLRRNLNR